MPVCMPHAPQGLWGFTALGQGTVSGCVPPVGMCGVGLCVPGAAGPNSGAWVPYHKVAGGVCGPGDLRLPPAHD